MLKPFYYISILIFIVQIFNVSMVLGQNVPPQDSTQEKLSKKPIMDRLEDFAKKDNLISKLMRPLFVGESKASTKDTTKSIEKAFKKYDGKLIRNVEIVVLDPFGYDIGNTYCKRVNWFQKQGNYLHYRTRPWVIKERLLFKKGDTISAYKISESERLIRQTESVFEVRIFVLPKDSASDSVDVYVISQDIWSIGASGAGDPLKRNGTVTLKESNFIGLGHTLENRVWYNPDYYDKWQYNGRYFVPQIANTFISAEAFYLTEDLERHYGVSFQRPFFSSAAHWAGGLSLTSHRLNYETYIQDTIHLTGTHKVRNQDVWLGYALNPKNADGKVLEKTQVLFSTRVMNTEYVDRNIYPDVLRNIFYNRVTWLNSIGYSFRDYFKDRNIFGFGKTEDIPIGYLVSATLGFDFNGPSLRPYFGAKAGFGKNNSSIGYSAFNLETGGFINKGKVEEGVIGAQWLFFTNVFTIKSFKIRQYMMNRAKIGYNRLPWEKITLNRGDGLRGFNSNIVGGTQKYILNYELDIFTPYKPLGFRLVPVIFADFGLLGTQDHTIFRSPLYQGYGFGLKIRNEKLTFTTFQISIHFFPNAASFGTNNFSFIQTQHSFYDFQSFQFSQPYVIPF